MTASAGADICNDPFLIIAGVNKAGTTSLFSALAQHPQISACRVKEPFFFLPREIPFNIRPRFQSDPLSSYLELFPDWEPGKVRLEASSLYFGVPAACHEMARALPQSRIVLILRDPILRLISSYQMAHFNGWLEPQLSFDEFALRLMTAWKDPGSRLFDSLELEQGLYAKHLGRWHEVFGRERVMTIWFDDLTHRPADTLARIAAFASLDAGSLAATALRKENPSRQVRWESLRSGYRKLKAAMQRTLPRNIAIRRLGRKAAQSFERAIDALTIRRAPRLDPKAPTLSALREFYREDVIALRDLGQGAPPWIDRYASHAPALKAGPEAAA